MIQKWLILVSVLIFTAFAPVYGQSGSYLDSIYSADDQGTSAVADEPDARYVTDDDTNTPPKVVDVPDPTGDPAQQKALERLQNIINQIMRILGGKMCGARVVVVVIPCEKIVPKPKPPVTGTSTATSTSTSTATSTGTRTATSTSTSTSTSTATATRTSTGTSTSTATSTGTRTATSTATSTGTSTATATSTGTGTATGKEAVRAAIKDKYGINAADGQNQTWSENQLRAADEALASLPSFFRKCTDTVYRDGPPYDPRIPPSAAAYVIVPQHKVHMLDLSAQMTQGAYNSLVAAYGRAPTTEEQMAYLKHNFKRTLVHEMTHCFQNTYPQVMQTWSQKFWPGGRLVGQCPTGYGRTQPVEDMAESVATYWTGGSIRNGVFVSRSGTTMDLERYNFIKKYIMDGKEYLN